MTCKTLPHITDPIDEREEWLEDLVGSLFLTARAASVVAAAVGVIWRAASVYGNAATAAALSMQSNKPQAFCLKALILFLLFSPLEVSADTTSLQIAEALKRAYLDSRYDSVETSVEQCRIDLVLKDTDACTTGSSTQSEHYFFDLRHHDAETLHKHAREVDGMWRFHVLLSPTGEWADRTNSLKAEANIRRQAAIEKYGRGKDAAIASSREFLLNDDMTDFFSGGTKEY